MMIKPEQFIRRSPVYRQLQKLGAQFGEMAGGACALAFAGATEGAADGTEQATDATAATATAEEAAGGRELALMDLSLLPKTGYRGPRALAWLETQKVVLPPENNRGAIQPEGSVAVRLSDGEALLLGNLRSNSELLDQLEKVKSRETPDGVYQVHRADSCGWFVVSGRLAPEMLAKLCGVDLSPEVFPQLQVAQTSLARTDAIVLRWDMGQTLAYHLFPGAALAEYLWDAVMDAMVEYGGRPAGLEALWSLLPSDKQK